MKNRSFLWQCFMQKALDWQWISTEKLYCVGSLVLFCFLVFKSQSHIQCRLIFLTAAIQEKILDFFAGLFYSNHLIHQTLHQVISIFFILYKMLRMTNFFKKIMWKPLWKTYLSLKPAEFYLRGINKLPDKWDEVIQNNSERTIEINSLFNYWWINYILLKWKLFITQLKGFDTFLK